MRNISLIFMALSFAFGPELSYEFLNENSKLVCVAIYPKEAHNIYFKTVPNIAIDEIGNIYAVDNRLHLFYKIDVILDETKTFSGPGQGPGELQNPTKVCLAGDKLLIKDDVGINLFHLNGNFINRFRVFTTIISFAADNQYVFVAATGEEKLIQAYSFQGKRIMSFREKYQLPQGIYEGFPEWFVEMALNTGNILVGKENIYFVSYLLSELYQYDRHGKLIRKTIIEEDDEVVKESRRYYFKEGQKRTTGRGFRFYKDKYLILGSCSFDGRLFFLKEKSREANLRKMEIVEISEKILFPIKKYLFEVGSKDAFEDFCVGGPNRISPDFYFSMYDDTNQSFLIKKFKEAKGIKS